MKISTQYAARRLDGQFGFDKHNLVLDFGCGPGFLIDYLITKQVQVVGVDINQDFLDRNRERYPAQQFILISNDVTKTTSILHASLGDQKFDYIILLSVSQYFPDTIYLGTVIGMLRQYLSRTGAIVIADVVDSQTLGIIDGMAVMAECLKRGRLFSFLRFVSYLSLSRYRAISRHNKLLSISSVEMEFIAEQNRMRLTKLGRMTLHPTRSSYLFNSAG